MHAVTEHDPLTLLTFSVMSFWTLLNTCSYFDLSSNKIKNAGLAFNTTSSKCTQVFVNLANNSLQAHHVQTLLGSYNYSTCPLHLDVSDNLLTTVPPIAFGFDGLYLNAESPRALELIAARNPIKELDANLFLGIYSLASVTIDMSFPTAGKVKFPDLFSFQL